MMSMNEYKEQFKKLSTIRKITTILCLPISLTLVAFLLLVYTLVRLWCFVDDHLRGIVGLAILIAMIKYISGSKYRCTNIGTSIFFVLEFIVSSNTNQFKFISLVKRSISSYAMSNIYITTISNKVIRNRHIRYRLTCSSIYNFKPFALV